jgi:flagellar motor switch protein FliN/FliY
MTIEQNNSTYKETIPSNIIASSEMDKLKEDDMQRFFPEISKTGVIEKGQFRLERFFSVPLQVRVVLGRKTVSIKEMKDYKIGSIIELDKETGSLMTMTIFVNGVPLYYGEIIINDDMFAIRITHIIDEKINSDNYLKDIDYPIEKTKMRVKSSDFDKKRFYDVHIEIRIEIGQATLPLKKILDCDVGTIIELNKCVNDPIIAFGNNVPVFYGKIVMIDDYLGFQITEIIE